MTDADLSMALILGGFALVAVLIVAGWTLLVKWASEAPGHG